MRTMYYRLKWWMISLMYKLGIYKDEPDPQLSICLICKTKDCTGHTLNTSGYQRVDEPGSVHIRREGVEENYEGIPESKIPTSEEMEDWYLDYLDNKKPSDYPFEEA